MKFQQVSEKITNLITKGRIKEALKEMQSVLQGSDRIKDLILQSSRFSDVKRQINNGLIDFEQAEIKKSRIVSALIDMLSDLEEEIQKEPAIENELPDIKPDVNIVNSKNVIIGKIKGDNTHIGDKN